MPRGSLKKIPLNEVRKNEAFSGLSASEAFEVASYVHFRAPLIKKNVELNARREGVYNDKFLDGADEDLPKQCWTVLPDTMAKVAVLRNKQWPGYSAFHQYNTTSYGGLYIGNGVKAVDIAFMF